MGKKWNQAAANLCRLIVRLIGARRSRRGRRCRAAIRGRRPARRVGRGRDSHVERVDERVVGGVVDTDPSGIADRRRTRERQNQMRVGVDVGRPVRRKDSNPTDLERQAVPVTRAAAAQSTGRASKLGDAHRTFSSCRPPPAPQRRPGQSVYDRVPEMSLRSRRGAFRPKGGPRRAAPPSTRGGRLRWEGRAARRGPTASEGRRR